jgi:hypothetical protein
MKLHRRDNLKHVPLVPESMKVFGESSRRNPLILVLGTMLQVSSLRLMNLYNHFIHSISDTLFKVS